MSWNKINLSKDLVINQESTKLMDAFLKLFQLSTQPTDAAIFSKFHSENGTETIYISPSAMDIIGDAFSSYSPVSCEKPTREGIGLIVGDTRSWQLFE